MATLTELSQFPSVPGLKEKIAAACWRTARNIFNELDTVDNHAERLAWAVRVLRAGGSEDLVFSEMLRAVVTIKDAAALSDTEIETTVSATVNHFALLGV